MKEIKRKSKIRQPKQKKDQYKSSYSKNLFAELVLHVHQFKGKGLKLKPQRSSKNKPEAFRTNNPKRTRMSRSLGKTLEHLTLTHDEQDGSVFRSYILDQQNKGRFEMKKIQLKPTTTQNKPTKNPKNPKNQKNVKEIRKKGLLRNNHSIMRTEKSQSPVARANFRKNQRIYSTENINSNVNSNQDNSISRVAKVARINQASHDSSSPAVILKTLENAPSFEKNGDLEEVRRTSSQKPLGKVTKLKIRPLNINRSKSNLEKKVTSTIPMARSPKISNNSEKNEKALLFDNEKLNNLKLAPLNCLRPSSNPEGRFSRMFHYPKRGRRNQHFDKVPKMRKIQKISLSDKKHNSQILPSKNKYEKNYFSTENGASTTSRRQRRRNPFQMKDNILRDFDGFKNQHHYQMHTSFDKMREIRVRLSKNPQHSQNSKHYKHGRNPLRNLKTDSEYSKKRKIRKNKSLRMNLAEIEIYQTEKTFKSSKTSKNSKNAKTSTKFSSSSKYYSSFSRNLIPNLSKIKTPLNQVRTDRYRPKSMSSARYYVTDLRNYYFQDSYCEMAKVFREHFEGTFHTVKNHKQFEPLSRAELEKKRVDLGERMSFSSRKILVLDLDETLIHAEYTVETEHPNVFKITTETGLTNYVSYLKTIQNHLIVFKKSSLFLTMGLDQTFHQARTDSLSHRSQKALFFNSLDSRSERLR